MEIIYNKTYSYAFLSYFVAYSKTQNFNIQIKIKTTMIPIQQRLKIQLKFYENRVEIKKKNNCYTALCTGTMVMCGREIYHKLFSSRIGGQFARPLSVIVSKKFLWIFTFLPLFCIILKQLIYQNNRTYYSKIYYQIYYYPIYYNRI